MTEWQPAVYTGECDECGETITEGEPIRADLGGWVCERCGEETGVEE